MNCCQLHITHQSTYHIYSFHQIQHNFKLSSEPDLIFCCILFQFELTFKINYQTGFSGEFMIQSFLHESCVNVKEFFSMSHHVTMVLIAIHDSNS